METTEGNKIKEGNKLIAEFMGFESYPFENVGGKGFDVTTNMEISEKDFEKAIDSNIKCDSDNAVYGRNKAAADCFRLAKQMAKEFAIFAIKYHEDLHSGAKSFNDAYDEWARTSSSTESPALVAHSAEGKEETMRIDAPAGTKVIYTGEGGYDRHKETGDKYLKRGGEYTVDRTEIENWHTDVYLKEVSGVAFNSVMFVEPLPSPPQSQTDKKYNDEAK